jgi:hypothetical protein
MTDCKCSNEYKIMISLISIVSIFLSFKIPYSITNYIFTKKYEDEFGISRKPEQKTYAELFDENLILKQKLRNNRKSKISNMNSNHNLEGAQWNPKHVNQEYQEYLHKPLFNESLL